MTIRICGDEWMDIKKLGEICTIVSGGTPSRTNTEFWDGGTIPWIKIGDIKEKHVSKADEYITQAGLDGSSAKMLSKGTILYTIFATLGEAGILTIDACTNQAIAGITIKNQDEVLADYLYYYLKSKKSYVNNLGRGVAQNNINLSILRNLEVPLPALPTQRQTVDILDKTAKVIEYRQQQLQKLDDLVKARFVELFVATDAASDWPYCTIADVSNDMRTGPFGSALHHDEFVDSGVFVLGIDNAVENKFSYNRMRYITAEKYQELKRYTVYPGDVIITIMGTVGRSAVIPADMPKAINTKHLACITPNAKMVNAQFLSCAFQVHPDIRAQLQKQCKGAIMDGLNLTIIKGLSFHIPPINLQDRFVGFYEQADKSKVAVQKALDEAQLLFDSLMQKYFG